MEAFFSEEKQTYTFCILALPDKETQVCEFATVNQVQNRLLDEENPVYKTYVFDLRKKEATHTTLDTFFKDILSLLGQQALDTPPKVYIGSHLILEELKKNKEWKGLEAICTIIPCCACK